LGVLFKFFLIFFGGIYLLRLLSPFLLKWLLSTLAKKASTHKQQSEAPKAKSKKKPSDTMGEYIDYEELD
jgi:hypothetical protein